jgi:hypothetical protein
LHALAARNLLVTLDTARKVLETELEALRGLLERRVLAGRPFRVAICGKEFSRALAPADLRA